jgi:hypothetical protein
MAKRRVLELQATAVGGAADCLERFDVAELLRVEATRDLELTGR